MHHRIRTDSPLDPGCEVVVSDEEFHHAARVVRLREGDPVELFDGRGASASGRVLRLERDRIVLSVLTTIPSRESPVSLTLAMALIQIDKFELVVQKATELGVRTIVPMLTDRSETRRERLQGKKERWARIVSEAVKQSGRAATPAIADVVSFDEVISVPGMRIIFDADEPAGEIAVADALTLMVGPEGGWSERELQRARETGCTFARMGPRRLRAETAAIVACAIAGARYGDLR